MLFFGVRAALWITPQAAAETIEMLLCIIAYKFWDCEANASYSWAWGGILSSGLSGPWLTIPKISASATTLQIMRKSKARNTPTMELLHCPVLASQVLERQLQRLLRIVLSLPGKPPNGSHAFHDICKPHSKIADCVHCELCHMATPIASQKKLGSCWMAWLDPKLTRKL